MSRLEQNTVFKAWTILSSFAKFSPIVQGKPRDRADFKVVLCSRLRVKRYMCNRKDIQHPA